MRLATRMSPALAVAAIACLTLPAAPALAQPEDPVSVRFVVDPAEVAPGGIATVKAHVTVEEGWHVYALSEPSSDAVASTLTTGDAAGLTAHGAAVEPTPKEHEVEYVGTFKVHGGTFTVSQQVRVAADAAGGPRALPVSFTYQACSEGESAVCLPPASADGEVTLTVSGEAAPAPGAPADAPANGGGFGVPGLDLGLGGASADEAVRVVASVSPRQVRPGDLVELRFDVAIADTWHIYATDTPTGLPTRLDLTLPAGARAVGPLEQPEPQAEDVKDFGPTRSHEGTVRFTQVVEVGEDVAPGELALAGTLHWQACDPKTCVDQEHTFTLPVTVDPQAAPSPVVRPVSAWHGGPPAAAPATGGEAPQGVVALTIASIGMGLLMLLMPCTYPMIPITVSIFSKGKSLSRGRTALRAGIYAGGIVVSFVAVGGLVQVLAGAKGQGVVNELATNPWVNLGIGAVFVYFAFSFFGYYEIGMPGFLQRLMQAGAAKRGQDGTVPAWSLFLMGLFFVLTSYTCGAPVVLGLFATATQAPHDMAVLWATFVFALTVAAPFFLLALVPGGMKVLPKSGSWFSVFKVALAFVELGFAIKFFRGAELQWEAVNLLTRDVTLALWVVLSVCAVVYLHGYFPVRFPHDPDLSAHSPRRYAWGWVFLLLAGYFGYGASGRELAPSVEAFILPDLEQGEHEHSVKFGPLSYRTDLAGLDEAKAWARAHGKPAFLMFTGHNCVNCVQMEKGVLPKPPVVEKLEQIPRVALFTDKAGDPAERAHKDLMLERYNRAGTIPCFFLIDGQGEIRAAQIGNTGVDGFLEFLERGGA